ncbi:adenylate/guanylate cyclase domain-containing protein [Fulvivirga sp.]|uniref:adenylate/guanylate cyclase domain-containing protein n=1 Tax=Fulvivirga sp. TaxID=1931237 RepID=UPI0032EEFF3C
MQMSPITKRNIARIIPFGLIWLVFGMTFMFVEYAAMGGFDNVATTAIRVSPQILVFASIAVTMLGLLIGAIEMIWLNRALSKHSFTVKIIYKLLFYALFLFTIILITFPIAASMEMKVGVFDARVWEKYVDYLTSITNLSTFVQMGVSLFACLFYAEISENIGQNVLFNFFTGKYHKPTEEERIFMFLDMKSSTAIAEKLGHIKYFELLKAYYDTMSNAIVKHEGEVYQYIGDEIVVSWEYKKGIRNNNCIKCFFAMKADLEAKAEALKNAFGVTPSFKAGLHYGMVTTGEIGALKKEIIFTGDVLNTTARIQALCNNLEVDNLISDELIDQLSCHNEFEIKKLGLHELRGRKGSVDIATVISPTATM